MSRLKEQGDLFWLLTHQETQSGIWTIFEFVVVRSFFADRNLLLFTHLTRHIFSCFTAYSFLCRT